MGHIVKTPAGTFRANWRDLTDRQKAKTFRTRKQAAAFLAEVESALSKGSYVDPRAGRLRFGEYAARWLSARNVQHTTQARDESLMRNHVLAQWSAVPIGRIDHLAVQQWVAQLGSSLSPATVDKCHNLLSLVLAAAVRDRLIGVNPADGVRMPSTRKKDTDDQVVTPGVLASKILPAIPDRYRALVALAGGTGLRWGECVGLRWDAVDLDAKCVRVIRVAVEVAGTVTAKPFPKSRAGRRIVPLPAAVVDLLTRHRDTYPAGRAGEVFTNSAGGPLRRTLFRARVWRPALVTAGLLGSVEQLGDTKYRATWKDKNGREVSADHSTRATAVRDVVRFAAGGLRFHDLRHSYATWLISRGVPVNDVQAVMGHEQASTTLNRYTHGSDERDSRVRNALADFSLTIEAQEDQK